MSSVAHENMCEFCKKRKVEEFLKNIQKNNYNL